MKRVMNIALLSCIVFAGVPMMVGCDRTTSEKKTSEVQSDGTVKKSEAKTTESPNGTTTTTEKKSVDKPANP